MSKVAIDMRSRARIWLGGLLTGALIALFGALGPAAQAAELGVKLWEAGTCVNETCKYKEIAEEVAKETRSKQAFTQAAGHPPFGLTTFELASEETGLKQKKPLGAPLKRVRVDVPQGLASNPQAPPKCSIKEFKVDKCPAATEVGTNELEVFAKALDTK